MTSKTWIRGTLEDRKNPTLHGKTVLLPLERVTSIIELGPKLIELRLVGGAVIHLQCSLSYALKSPLHGEKVIRFDEDVYGDELGVSE